GAPVGAGAGSGGGGGGPAEPLGDRRPRRIWLEARIDLPRALGEERRGIVERQHRHGELLLRRNVESDSARGEDVCIKLRDGFCRNREEVLEVVEDEQRALAGQVLM